MHAPYAPAPILRLAGIAKSFARPAVIDVSLAIAPGETYALLGRNGAGKTTTLRILAGLLAPDRGRVEICGIDLAADPLGAKRHLAWLPDDPLLYDPLTPLEYLGFIAGLWSLPPAFARPRAHALLERIGLWPNRNQATASFSRGMRQRLALAGALIHAPRLLVMDEPLTGLDAAAAALVLDLLAEQTANGAAILLTTHILPVAERVATRIGVMHQGRLRAEGAVADLRGDSPTLEAAFLALTQAP